VWEIRKSGIVVGMLAGISSIFLWFVLIFYNPYSKGTAELEFTTITFLLLLFPAGLAIISTLTLKTYLMLIAFLMSLPISAYLIGTPGIFVLFGVTSISYLISFLFLFFAKKRSGNRNN
jgi:hypothetical protein